jgi:hypothetical protein
MSSFVDELHHQGLLEDIISFDSTPSTVGDEPTPRGVRYTQEHLNSTTTLVGNVVAGSTKEKVFK